MGDLTPGWPPATLFEHGYRVGWVTLVSLGTFWLVF